MFPFLDISIHGAQVSLPLDPVFLGVSLLFLFISLNKTVSGFSNHKILLLTLLPSVFAAFGGAWVYCLFVGKELTFHPEGRTYYGAFFAQSLLFYLLAGFFSKESQSRNQAMDAFSVASFFIYSFLRMGCFANGCCYGKLCRYPWAVIFKDDRSLTPLLGLPLHPTQIYGVIHGFFGGCILTWFFLKRKTLRLEGRLYFLLLVLLGAGRFVIEPLRADLKNSIWGGVAMNQWISAVIVFMGVWFLRGDRFRKAAFRLPLFPLLLISLLSGCGFAPSPPGPDTVYQTDALGPGVFAHQMKQRARDLPKNPRNLLFIAVDDAPEDLEMFRPALSQLYKTQDPPRMEEVLWWYYSPKLTRLYHEVVRIQYDSLDWGSFLTALNYLESIQDPFDSFIVTHGLPNHLISSKKRFPISWKDLAGLSGENRLHFLDTVFLQSCYGSTLAQDFRSIGASSVISFQGIHFNILFFDVFLKSFIRASGEAKSAFQDATSTFERQITHTTLYQFLIKKLMDMPALDYANEIRENNWMPSLLE